MQICEYGCGKESKYTTKTGKACCEPTFHQCEGYLQKLRKGALKMHIEGRGNKFSDEQRKKSIVTRVGESVEKAFVKNSTYSNEFIKPKFIELYVDKYECQSDDCDVTDNWKGKKIILELDHIDGDNRNNESHNLRLLCPNCHSCTDTFRGRNINTGQIKVTDEQLVESIKKNKNTRQVLLDVGLTPRGANYERVKKVKQAYAL